MFPLFDGVSVVGFKCTIAERKIVGLVKEKSQARKDYKEALDRGESAGLLEQFYNVDDCFTTLIGNIPPNEKVTVEITYLGELNHDAETDGIRLTIPTAIAPRYGSAAASQGEPHENASSATAKEGIRILVDITVENEVAIRGVQSPSHPIAMAMGRTSSMPEDAFDNQHASASLTLGTTELEKDFVLVVTSKGHDNPLALLETHPTIPNHRALLATLVPKFNLPSIHPEIVFVADRSGSMGGKIPILVSALKIFLKSLPVGIKFNICSFGSEHRFLWPKSKSYDESSLSQALTHVEQFDASFGGTEILSAVKNTVKNRYEDMQLEVIIVTDGQIWNQTELFSFINEASAKSVRFFSLGIGSGASSSLVTGIARAGDGFAQFVGEGEKMEKRVVRMLKGALTPHIKDYTMEVKFDKAEEEYEIVESVTESLKDLDTNSVKPVSKMKKKIISLFDDSTNIDDDIDNNAGKYDHLPLVSTPKLLQAPHRILPLYPFNRTSVYLLISAESCQHTPKSIVLRATSEHGPLELEIPIQDIGIGETIHQLAARKTTQELEEARGWITEAKDKDGKLLKSKYEGRWEEMVEQEAVRLSVQFQVGSKWCSFVAVEKNAINPNEGLPDYELIDNEKLGHYGRLTGKVVPFASSFPQPVTTSLFPQPPVIESCFVSGGGFFGASQSDTFADCYGSSSVPDCNGPPTSVTPGGTLSTAGFGATWTVSPLITNAQDKSHTDNSFLTASSQAYDFSASQLTDPSIHTNVMACGFGGGGQAPRSSKTMFGGGSSSPRAKKWSFSAFSAAKSSSASPPPIAATATPAAASRSLSQRVNTVGQSATAAPPSPARMARAVPSALSVDWEDVRQCDMGPYRRLAKPVDEDLKMLDAAESPTLALPVTDEEKMHELISLQAFDGSWNLTDRLFNVLGIGQEKAKSLLAGLEGTVIATVLAVAFLEGIMAAEEGIWEMVVEKAKGWLDIKTGDGKNVDRLAKVKKDIFEVV
jgi:von Willebrand factor type A domain/Vault protein inter-alpha-trypsin domain